MGQFQLIRESVLISLMSMTKKLLQSILHLALKGTTTRTFLAVAVDSFSSLSLFWYKETTLKELESSGTTTSRLWAKRGESSTVELILARQLIRLN